MNNYYVEFLGELKDDQKMQKRFGKHYNRWCKVINEHQSELNDIFDREWKGEPIQDYSECKEYNDWMLKQYKGILKKSGLKKDLFLDYDIDPWLQLYGMGRFGERKGKGISFVLKQG
jgi:hypothetical protein